MINDNNPYVGPRALLEKDTIFGRDNETQRLLNLLIANRIVLLHSPSGAGKSSLINAGLVPLLSKRGFTVLGPLRVNLEPPVDIEDVENCNRYTWSVLQALEEHLPEEQRADPTRLMCTSIEDYLKQFRESNPGRLVLIFDQFEEILTIDPIDKHHQRKNFFVKLGEALFDTSIWALFTAREDFIAALDPYLTYIPTRLQNNFRLDFLGVDAARAAIQGPLKAKGLGISYTPAAVKKLVDDLASIQIKMPNGDVIIQEGSYVEPVQLQVACRHLFNHLQPGSTEITVDMVEGVTDVDTSLSVYYQEQINRISNETGVHIRQIRDFFEEELITPQKIRGLVQAGTSQRLTNEVVRKLVDAYLVRSEKRLNSTWYELAHDRLIHPILNNNKDWRDDNLNLLQRQAQVWVSEKHNTSLLLRGEELARWQEWAVENPGELGDAERQFLEKSEEREVLRRERAERERIEQELKLEKARELAEAEKRRAEQQSRSAKQLRAAFLVAIVLALIAVGFMIESRNQKSVAVGREAQAEVAKEEAMNAKATAVAAKEEAVNAKATAVAAKEEAESNERKAKEEGEKARLAEEELDYLYADLADNWKSLIYQAQQMDQIVKTISVGISRAAMKVTQIDLSLLLSIEALRIHDNIEARQALLYGLQYKIEGGYLTFYDEVKSNTPDLLTFSRSGQYLGWSTIEGEVSILDVTSFREVVEQEKMHPAPLTSLALCDTEEGFWIATGSTDRKVFLKNGIKDSPRLVEQLPSVVTSVDFNNDCSQLTAAAGSIVKIYDILPDNTISAEKLFSQGFDIQKVSWSQDGSKLATSNAGNQVIIYDLGTGEGTLLKTVFPDIRDLNWRPDGTSVYTLTGLGVIEQWNIETGGIEAPFPLETGAKTGEMAFSHDGRMVAVVAGASYNLDIWDTNSGERINTLELGSSDRYSSIAFGVKDGQILLAHSVFNRLFISRLISEHKLSEELGDNKPVGAIGWVAGARFKDGEWYEEGYEVGVYQAGEWHEEGYEEGDYQAGEWYEEEYEEGDYQAGEWFVAASESGLIRVTPFDINKPGFERQTQHSSPITVYSFRPGRAKIALGDQSGYVSELDFMTGKSTLPTQVAQSPILAVTSYDEWTCDDFSCTEKPVIVSAYCSTPSTEEGLCTEVEIAVKDKKYRFKPTSTQTPIQLVYLANWDGAWLAASSPLNIWKIADSESEPKTMSEWTDITSMVFYDHRYLAVASNQSIYFVDYAFAMGGNDKAYFGPLSVFPTGQIISMTSSYHYLHTLDADGDVLRWEISTSDWIVLACQTAGRNLTQAEWETYFPAQEYRVTCPANETAEP
jgi:WD40 repeat protein